MRVFIRNWLIAACCVVIGLFMIPEKRVTEIVTVVEYKEKEESKPEVSRVVKVTTYKVVYNDNSGIEYIEAENILDNGKLVTFYDSKWQAIRVISADQIATVIRVNVGEPW